jgi:hypothetical protein
LAAPASPSALAATLRDFRSKTVGAVASNRDPILSSTLQRSSRVLTSTVASPAPRVSERSARPLSWALRPYNTCRRRGSTSRRRKPFARCVPPSGFCYPRDGLLPSTPGRVCFIPTAFLGFPPAERSPPGRWFGVSPKAEPTRRFTATCSEPPKRAGRTSRPRHLGFGPPPEFRGPPRVFNPRHTGGSLGVSSPPGFCRRSPCRRLSPACSPYALRRGRTRRSGWRLRVSISDRLAPLEPRGQAARPSRATLLRFLRLLVPTGSKTGSGSGF